MDIAAGATLNAIGEMVFESGAILYDQNGSTVSGTNYTFKRNARFPNEGRYSVYGSPIEDASTSSQGSLVYSYREHIDYMPNDGLDRFNQISSPESMIVGKGYFSAFDDEVLVTGAPNTGSEFIGLSYSESSGDEADYDGFNLVANPFPAPLNIDDLISAYGPGGSEVDGLIEGSIYLWRDGGSDLGRRTNDDYEVYNPLGSTSGFTGKAASFQGFFVKATGIGTLTVLPSMRTSGIQFNDDSGFLRREEPFRIRMDLSDEDRVSSALVGYVEDADNELDKKYDAMRLGGKEFAISSVINNKPFSIQGRKDGFDTDSFKISYTTNETGPLRLKLKAENQPQTKVIYLHDKQLGEMIEINESLHYDFVSDAGTHSERFEMIVSSDIVTSYEDLSNKVTFERVDMGIRIGAPAGIQHVSIFNLSGKMILEKSIQKARHFIAEGEFNGAIIVNVSTIDNTTVSKKLIIK